MAVTPGMGPGVGVQELHLPLLRTKFPIWDRATPHEKEQGWGHAASVSIAALQLTFLCDI